MDLVMTSTFMVTNVGLNGGIFFNNDVLTVKNITVTRLTAKQEDKHNTTSV